MSRPRLYCAVHGCMNSTISKPEISYFKLPADEKRRSKWLRLIAREDLANKPPVSYTVCEEHFNSLDVLPGTHRKRLKTNSIPSLFLPELTLLGIKENQMPTEVPTLVEKCVQTDETCMFLPEVQIKIERTNNDEKCVQTDETITLSADACTQTTTSLSPNSPRKRKAESDLLECRKINKEQESEKHERDIFHKMCDRFLTKELAEMVKINLEYDVLESRKRNKEHETEKLQREILHKLCDRLLTRELAEMVKAQTH